jgi:cysteine synthase A
MIERAAELAQEPGTYATDQFNNPYSIPGHRAALGREIWEQTDGRVAAFVQGIGTASALLGVGRGAEGAKRGRGGRGARAGGVGGDHRWLERARSRCRGWSGWCRRSGIRRTSTKSGPIDDGEALAMSVRLAREEGIFAGTSSGANVVGALRLAGRLPQGSVVVTLAVDSGFKYMTGPPFGVLINAAPATARARWWPA